MTNLIKMALVIVLAALVVPAYSAKEVRTRDFSGWLDDYDSLVYSEERSAFVFFNERMRGEYNKVILQSVTVYAVDAKANTRMATRAADYLTDGVRAMLEQRGILAAEPGPGVLRYSMAITGVEKSTEGLKPHNLIPVSAIFRGAKAATGNLGTYIDTMFEAELVDSVTGERAAAIVRKGIGVTDKKSGDDLEFEDIVPTLDLWLDAYAGTLDEFLARRN